MTEIIAVTGATGAQGGGLVRAILASPEGGFTARAFNRKADGEAARALSAQGVEVFAADPDDEASLVDAFAGARGTFCVTNFWEHVSPVREVAQAANMARAPKAAGAPTTFLKPSFYWENLIYFGMGPKAGEDGTLAVTLPLGDAKRAGIAAADIDGCAYGIFEAGNGLVGRTVGIAGGRLTGDEMAAGLSRALGREVRYNAVSPGSYRSFGFPAAEEMGNKFQFNVEFADEYLGSRNVDAIRLLDPSLHSCDSWLDANASKIPLS